nr:pentatricopeptide repeat-containing protein At4g16390, chloroplastic [Ipomoea batatas]
MTDIIFHEFSETFRSATEMYLATSAQHLSLSASSSGISMENSCSKAITSSTLSKLSRLKSFWKSALSVLLNPSIVTSEKSYNKTISENNSAPAPLSQEPLMLCKSLNPRHILQFALKPKPSYLPLRIYKPLRLQLTQVSQSPSNYQHPDEKVSSSSKGYVWINPKSRRASKLRQVSYDSQHSSLLSISRSLDSCSAIEEDVSSVLSALGGDAVEQDAVVILNNMSNPDTALLAMNYFRERMDFSQEVILYNVTLKVLKKNKDFSRAEKLFDEMLERGVRPNKITFLTIISCARISSLPEKAVEWFEKMPAFGCQPDNHTYSAMIDSYGKAGNVDKALSLYDYARAEQIHMDAGTFCTLIRIHAASGNFDGCLNVFEEMKKLGSKFNLVAYNNLLDAMGRAGRPEQCKNIYNDMIQNGFQPSWATYAALIRAYCRARYGGDALKVYKELKDKGVKLNVKLYNTLLAMCSYLGLVDEANGIYNDMKEMCKPDHRTFSLLITIYSCCGKVSEAEAILNEMVEAGVVPDIFVLTSLVQCYGKANRSDDVVRMFDRLSNLGLTPDERFCCCLLNVLQQTPKEEMHKLAACIEKASPKLGYIVKLLMEEEKAEDELFKQEAAELLNSIGTDVRKPYCNCLIDVSVSLNRLQKACELLDLGITLGIYTDIQSKEPARWSLHLKSLSLGAAVTALHIWMNDLNKTIENGEELPLLLRINTGRGKHVYSEKGLAQGIASHLRVLNAPFHEAPNLAGWFLATNIAVTSWLKSRHSEKIVAA